MHILTGTAYSLYRVGSFPGSFVYFSSALAERVHEGPVDSSVSDSIIVAAFRNEGE